MHKLQIIFSQELESSCFTTPEWNKVYRQATNYLKKLIKPHASTIKFRKGHFYFSGFIQTNAGDWFYISIFDARNKIDRILIRTAKNDKDFTGGGNHYITFDERFEERLIRFINPDAWK